MFLIIVLLTKEQTDLLVNATYPFFLNFGGSLFNPILKPLGLQSTKLIAFFCLINWIDYIVYLGITSPL